MGVTDVHLRVTHAIQKEPYEYFTELPEVDCDKKAE